MRYNKKRKCKKCSCNKGIGSSGCNKGPICGQSDCEIVEYKPKTSCINDCSECKRLQQLSQERCEQANCVINKASKVAQQAQCAENRAEQLKKQAIEECSKANCLWEEYKSLTIQGERLMEQAQELMESSVKCYKECYHGEVGCNLEDYGYEDEDDCGCERPCEPIVPPCGCERPRPCGCQSGCGCSCGCR